MVVSNLAQDRDRWRSLLNAVMNGQVPKNARSILTSRETVSFSKSTLLHGVSKAYDLRERLLIVL